MRNIDGVRRARTRASAVAEMLVRYVGLIVIGRTLHGQEQ